MFADGSNDQPLNNCSEECGLRSAGHDRVFASRLNIHQRFANGDQDVLRLDPATGEVKAVTHQWGARTGKNRISSLRRCRGMVPMLP